MHVVSCLVRPRIAATVTATCLALTGCTSTAPAGPAARPPVSTPAAVTPSPTTSQPGTGPVTAADRLRHLADTLATRPGDAKQASRYPHTYLRTQHFDRATNVIARTQTTRWRAIDGTGRVDTRRLPERRDLTRTPTSTEQHELAAAPTTTDHYYDPGQLGATLTEPIPTDQAVLTAKLFEHQPAETGPQALLWAICDLNRYHYLNQTARASALRILAGIPGITYTRTGNDIAGRTGTWYQLDTAGNRDIIALDPADGRLLVCSQNTPTAPPASFSYTLYLDADRTARPGQTPTPAGTTHPAARPAMAG